MMSEGNCCIEPYSSALAKRSLECGSTYGAGRPLISEYFLAGNSEGGAFSVKSAK